MAQWGDADFEQLRGLQDRLQKLQNVYVREFCEEASKELAARLLALVIERTPIGQKPKFKGKKTKKVTGASGKEKSFLTADAVRYESYWGGYDGGTLKRGWTAGKDMTPGEYAKSLPIEKSGQYYTVKVINPVKYASYVEFGHRQTPGRFVPAIGKRLKHGWANGKYFLTISEDILRSLAPNTLQKKLDAFLQEVFNG